MPSRTGDLSYLYLLKKRDISTGQSIGSLIVVRILDVLAITILLSISILAIGVKTPNMLLNTYFTFIFFLFTFFTILTFIYYIRGSTPFKRLFTKFFYTTIRKLKLIKFVNDKYLEIVYELNKIKTKNKIFHLFICSMLIWAFSNLFSFVLIQGLGVNVSIWIAIIASSFVVLSSMLPLQTIAGFGVVEGTLSATLVLFSVPKELAITSSFAFHVVTLTFSAILAAVSIVVYREYL